MLSTLTNHKIQPEHLDRQALIYVRQSTLVQVRENTGSTARQYDLTQRALDLGWPQEHITVIDQDQGLSGASATGRDGFQFLVAEVGLCHAGAVLSLEASRLARSCSDWYRLIEICALTETLVIDEEGIYDPGQYNDRLLLGFKGTMSEAELHWLRSRLLGGKLEKAQKGNLRFRLPTGLAYDPTNRVVLDPDQQVQQAVRLVFDLFDQHGSALAVVKHFATHQLLFPTCFWGGANDGQLAWNPLGLGRVLAILHNPAYTGAYVFGRTKTRTRTLPGESPRIKGRTRQVKCNDWPIVLHQAHPAYITWDQFLRNQQRLDDNRTFRPEDRRGAVREGSALLQGIVLCGRCGRRMSVRYLQDGNTPSYECNQLHSELAGTTCQFVRGDTVDAAVARIFLEAMQPAQLEVSMATLDQIEARALQIDRQWQLRLERAKYEADLARRRFFAVDPENRLVARNLERDWNDKLAEIERLERQHASVPKLLPRIASPDERHRILALAQDLPAIWHAPTTTNPERKQLLRFLVKDVTLSKRETTINIGIRWQTEALTELDIPRPKRASEIRRTDPVVVNRIRELAHANTDRQIAVILNREQLTSGTGQPFSGSKVQWVRYAYGIPTTCTERPASYLGRQRPDGRYSARAAAELLNVNVSTIADWCKSGRLDGIQSVPHGPHWVKLTPEIISELRKAVRQRWSRRTSK
ncbi:MAG: recombinase family protein [Chloroflexi bacterium]|nr:recombinase family protein [Chloroflexota bacterium]